MGAVTIQDLDNAQLDCQHIAEIATSTADTATDRLGHTKLTMQGVIDTMRALNPRGAWTTATAYAVRDLVTQAGVVYLVTQAHTSGVFATDLAAGRLAVYQGVVGNDLANSADPAKGAALVGYRGVTVAQFLDDRTRRGLVSAELFGTQGAPADDTAAIQAAVDFAASIGAGVYLSRPAYNASKIRIKNGCHTFCSDGATITGTSATPEAIIEMDGEFFGSTPVTKCRVFGFTLDGGGVSRRGVFAATAITCEFFGNTIRNLNAVSGDSGICLHWSSSQNKVYANSIYLPANVGEGVFLQGKPVDLYGGWGNGNIAAPSSVVAYNIVCNNYIEAGLHGVTVSAGSSNIIHTNVCNQQLHRGVILSPNASYNVVANNNCLFFGSSGIHMAYGSIRNKIIGNRLYSPGAVGEGGIQAYVSCQFNDITNNHIEVTTNYGIYLAIDAFHNTVNGNTITGNIVKAGIAIENDWANPLPAGANYSRPNYSAPPGPRTQWPNSASFRNSIVNNTLIDIPGTAAAIILTQFGSVSGGTTFNTIQNNTVIGTQPLHYLYVFEEDSGQCVNNVLKNNTFENININAVFASRGRGHFSVCEGNSILNTVPTVFDIPANSAIIDVGRLDYVSTAAYSVATTVTNFTNGMSGQQLTVRMSSFTTIQNNANVKLKGGINAGGTDANNYLFLRNLNGVWVETGRTF